MTEPLSEDNADQHAGRKTAISRDDLLAAARRVFEVPKERVAVKTRATGKGGSKYGRFARTGEFITVREGPARLRVNLFDYLDTGLFLDHRPIRGRIAAESRELQVLNLFAYTGGATVACAKAGASVCHVDAAKGMVAWAKDNARLSGLADAPIRWIVDDCAKFVEREIRRGKTYDAIIMDPPSYGRGPSGEVWKLEENLYPFVELVSRVLSDDPLFFIINSYTTGLAPSVMRYLTETLVAKKYGGSTQSDELGLPVRDTGLALPCGATCRWTKERP